MISLRIRRRETARGRTTRRAGINILVHILLTYTPCYTFWYLFQAAPLHKHVQNARKARSGRFGAARSS